MICPSCKRDTISYQRWNEKDMVAVCRSIKPCGYRLLMPKMVGRDKRKLDEFVHDEIMKNL